MSITPALLSSTLLHELGWDTEKCSTSLRQDERGLLVVRRYHVFLPSAQIAANFGQGSSLGPLEQDDGVVLWACWQGNGFREERSLQSSAMAKGVVHCINSPCIDHMSADRKMITMSNQVQSQYSVRMMIPAHGQLAALFVSLPIAIAASLAVSWSSLPCEYLYYQHSARTRSSSWNLDRRILSSWVAIRTRHWSAGNSFITSLVSQTCLTGLGVDTRECGSRHTVHIQAFLWSNHASRAVPPPTPRLRDTRVTCRRIRDLELRASLWPVRKLALMNSNALRLTVSSVWPV
ncbi:predicted protein [Plenodomus lingam JN3]|uniref:Predicted protein n=1 Tax=Leptosphaeria maculans (strain JN3 / isolate v23.1.3 / race Av1-4-5-6-7-8) TaxID=985895 RepID=E4ZZ03_LEPMJ|nr:predicted protein [Plenodomus lingam JN3]CBX96438.1 predicted protein [Plenodomus lingam JN3]